MISAAALSLCYPVNKEVPRLRRYFMGVRRGEAKPEAREKNLVDWTHYARIQLVLIGRCPPARHKLNTEHISFNETQVFC